MLLLSNDLTFILSEALGQILSQKQRLYAVKENLLVSLVPSDSRHRAAARQSSGGGSCLFHAAVMPGSEAPFPPRQGSNPKQKKVTQTLQHCTQEMCKCASTEQRYYSFWTSRDQFYLGSS